MTRLTFKRAILRRSSIFLVLMFLGAEGVHAQQPDALPDNISMKTVKIWSEGTRIAGDLYRPNDIGPDEKRPTIILSHGWGGTKANCRDIAIRLASEAGFICLAIDYRGWGESDSRLQIVGDMPKPDENGEATVRVKVIRTVVDPWDQLVDIQHAIDYILGEPDVDTQRLGYWGSSYSGGHAIWLAAHEPRLACSYGQVATADSRDLMRTSFEEHDIAKRIAPMATQRARGEIMPVPQNIDQAPRLRGWPILEKVMRYHSVDDAHKIGIPICLVDAENEELYDRRAGGQLAFERARANGSDAEYHVVEGITHYGIYTTKAKEAGDIALAFYRKHLGK
ncbi:MAG: alpha/beta fold hydrolase [Candidatus Hydrogenedentota bacterium]